MKLKTIATVLALCLGVSAPSAIADKGGVPHSSKPCPVKSKSGKVKKPAKNNRGKKCGHQQPAPPPVDPVDPVV